MCLSVKRLLCFLAALLLVLSPLFSEKLYSLTESQMQSLEKELTTLEELATTQEEQIKKLNSQLAEQEKLLKKSKDKMIIECITIGGVSFCVGALVTSLIIIGVQDVNSK